MPHCCSCRMPARSSKLLPRDANPENLLHAVWLLGLRTLSRAGGASHSWLCWCLAAQLCKQNPKSLCIYDRFAGRFLNVPGPWCRDAPPPFWQEPRRPPGGGARARCGAACCGNSTVRGDFYKVRC